MNKPAEPLTAAAAFDPADFLPQEVGEITNHQTDLPRIAKDAKLVAAIEAKLEQLPTQHELYRRDSRQTDFLLPESVHLVVTSPPYWTLKGYNVNEGQVWAACFFTSNATRGKKGQYQEPNEELSSKNFAISLHARAAAFARMGEGLKVLEGNSEK